MTDKSPAVWRNLRYIPRIFPACAFWLMASPSLAGTGGIVLLSVEAPNPRIDSSCDHDFRAGISANLTAIWDQCQVIGSTEPSDCQRNLFDLCIRAARLTAQQTQQSCAVMSDGGRAVSAASAPAQGQSRAQARSAALGAVASAALRALIASLESGRSALERHRRAEQLALRDRACSGSPLAEHYRALQSELAVRVGHAEKLFLDLKERKRTSLIEVGVDAKEAQTRRDLLGGSLSPAALAPTSARSELALLESPLRAARLLGTQAPSRLALPPARGADFGQVPSRAEVSRTAHGGTQVEIAQESISSWEQVDVSLAAVAPAARPAVSPGSGFFAQLGITVDPAFLDVQKNTIEGGIRKVPACLYRMFRAMKIQKARLQQPRDGCYYGQADEITRPGPFRNVITLDPQGCGELTKSMIVHELYHIVDWADGQRLGKRYKIVQERMHPRCPVTEYGAEDIGEDFAESGTVLHYPEGAEGGQPYDKQCVRNKLDQFRRLVWCTQ